MNFADIFRKYSKKLQWKRDFNAAKFNGIISGKL